MDSPKALDAAALTTPNTNTETLLTSHVPLLLFNALPPINAAIWATPGDLETANLSEQESILNGSPLPLAAAAPNLTMLLELATFLTSHVPLPLLPADPL
jgi:hypothetical protein